MDINPFGQPLPAILRMQFNQQRFQGYALQGVLVLRVRVTFRDGHSCRVIVNRVVLYVLHPLEHKAIEWLTCRGNFFARDLF